MSYKEHLESNNADLQTILDKVNNLPNAGGAVENLDVEFATQETLLTEQDAKIAELGEILASKTSGVETCTVRVINDIQIEDAFETGIDVCLFEHIPTADEQWTFNFYEVNDAAEFEVPKNSLFCVRPYYDLPNETVLAKTDEVGDIAYAGQTIPWFSKTETHWEIFDTFFIYGDCTITGIVG